MLVLLLPRILDVLCFWGAAGIFFWNQENGNYKYFAKRILNLGSTTNFWHTFLELKTIPTTMQSFPDIHVHQGGLFFSTLFFALFLLDINISLSNIGLISASFSTMAGAIWLVLLCRNC